MKPTFPQYWSRITQFRDFNFSFSCFTSSLTFCSITFAQICVVLILVCPKSFDTVSIGTTLQRVTVVAKICLAICDVNGFSIPELSDCFYIFQWFPMRYLFCKFNFLFACSLLARTQSKIVTMSMNYCISALWPLKHICFLSELLLIALCNISWK